ncbi:uncharacterized protein LOC127859844 isoform X1 [Dreissena polymorpha]|uniref:uncharacterized protein LOC127859844 isoform X1 n=1 Tax=Dreissena polymorpha TaxID=45954 RepID=UPI002263FA2D|nr:uncharacterized protein LOC127859844 isoform X1 [Dreissena polymorpha]
MNLMNSFGCLAFVFTVNGEYFLSNTLTHWHDVKCNMAEPELDYQNNRFEIKESIQMLPSRSEAWVGYISTKVPFLLLGCAKLTKEQIYTVQSIGYCHNVCGGGLFGTIAMASSAQFQCRCVLRSVDILLKQCFGMTNTLCTDCWPIYTQTTVTAVKELGSIDNLGLSTIDCLTYYYPTFHWSRCEDTQRKVMCSKQNYTDSTAKASVIDKSEITWRTGIPHCLKYNMYPASQCSIMNAGFGLPESQPYWTGVIRAHTLVKKSTICNGTSIPEEGYAWITDNDKTIHLSFLDVKQAICVEANATPLSTTTILKTQDSTHSTYANHVEDQISTNVDSNSVGVGVGVSVAVLFAVGGAVIVIVLKRRGLLPCRLESNNAKTNSESRECASKSNESYEDEIKNHNNCIMEKCAQSVDEREAHKNKADQPNVGNTETDNYNSIDEIDEHYQSVKDEFVYTNKALQSGTYSRKPDNVYNKLKLDLPGDDAHVGRLGHNISKAGSDYDTTAVARRNDGDGDYSHIPHPDSTTCARLNGLKDDYEVINGQKIKFSPSDSADYAHVRV